MTNDRIRSFYHRLDAALDHREDPLADDELIDLLDEHPELLDSFAAERASLHQLEQQHPTALPTGDPAGSSLGGPTRTRPRWRTVAVALFAAGLLLALPPIGSWLRSESPTVAHPPRILSASLTVRPMAMHSSVQYVLYQPRLQTPTITLELYDQRNKLR